MADKEKEIELVEYIVTSKFAHFKPNDIIEFEKDNVPSAARAHVEVLGKSKKEAEDESIGVLKDLHEKITGNPAHHKAGAVKISASILEFLSKDEEEGNTDE